MKTETMDKLCCPFDKSELELTETAKDLEANVIEGMLICRSCKRVYPIISGIPIMNPDEYREFRLEQPFLQRITDRKITERFLLEE